MYEIEAEIGAIIFFLIHNKLAIFHNMAIKVD